MTKIPGKPGTGWANLDFPNTDNKLLPSRPSSGQPKDQKLKSDTPASAQSANTPTPVNIPHPLKPGVLKISSPGKEVVLPLKPPTHHEENNFKALANFQAHARSPARRNSSSHPLLKQKNKSKPEFHAGISANIANTLKEATGRDEERAMLEQLAIELAQSFNTHQSDKELADSLCELIETAPALTVNFPIGNNMQMAALHMVEHMLGKITDNDERLKVTSTLTHHLDKFSDAKDPIGRPPIQTVADDFIRAGSGHTGAKTFETITPDTAVGMTMLSRIFNKSNAQNARELANEILQPKND